MACQQSRSLCCKDIHLATPMWSGKEFEDLSNILPPDMIKKEEEFQEKHKDTSTTGTCLYLSEDGLCGLQVKGLPKPVGCSSFRVGNKACVSTRIRNGIKTPRQSPRIRRSLRGKII